MILERASTPLALSFSTELKQASGGEPESKGSGAGHLRAAAVAWVGMQLSRRASLLLPLSLVACDKTRSPRAVSQEFIDRYYIERDHTRALQVAEGGAAERVRAEKKLLEDAQVTGSYAGVSPRVFYNLLKQEPKGEQTELTYALTIDSSGVEMKKQVLIKVAKFGPSYKVTFFNERDVTPHQ